ncbi:hypothetical protein NQ318_013062 [Aromia moschata]|uniref:C2H2-type domain-containing protein n=1 Tax=Aromia moschata TaxID=1265417 RepID=A0AAV8XEY2_9CUCU|nr:hypothetical protein NQ318_013062 [Aromia moschata]
MTTHRACKLCFKESKDFQVVDEFIREILDYLLLKIDFSLNKDYVICDSCADSIYTFFEFKSFCLYSEDHMVPFIRTMNGMKVDIVEVAYLTENSGAANISNSDDAVCRLCLKKDRCVDLNILKENFGEDIIAKCLPELDIKSTRDPKICLSCQTSLVNYYEFVTKCLIKQENIVDYDDREACSVIKSEELDIKMEVEECDRAGNVLAGQPAGRWWRNVTHCRNTNNSLLLIHSNVMPSEDTVMKFFLDTSYNSETNDMSIKSDPNQDASEVTTYDCNLCSFKTKYKRCLTQHMLIHKDASEVMTYRCPLCSYKTKWRKNLTQHMLIHKDASEVTTYDCSFCSYKTKFKSHITQHMLTHKDSSEVTTYQCTLCSYKVKIKSSLRRHMLIHKDASEVTTYDCSFCSYRTKYKSSLTQHLSIHKDASKTTTYECTLCSYKTKFKKYLTSHMLTHQKVSNAGSYGCQFCSFKAKRKIIINDHIKRIHPDVSKVTTDQAVESNTC